MSNIDFTNFHNDEPCPTVVKPLKTYRVTFWRGNPQLAHGGYHKVEIMRGANEENVCKRAYKKTANYGSYTPVKVEETIEVIED